MNDLIYVAVAADHQGNVFARFTNEKVVRSTSRTDAKAGPLFPSLPL